MKAFIFIVVVLFLSGCSTKSSYLLPASSASTIATTKVQIGVKKVEVPAYLDSDKILVKSGVKVDEIGSKFVAPPKELLTQRAIKLFKQSLNDPYVFLYPWDVKEKKGYIVEIKLDNFLYDNGEAVVAGSYYIKNSKGSIMVAKNFRYQEGCGKSSEEIVSTLSSLFDKVVVEIAQKIAK